MIKPPFILTLTIDKEAFLFFNTLRQENFPASRNFINAHITLFHALPNNKSIVSDVKDVCYRQKPFILTVKEPASIGKGVAFKIESNELLQLHKSLQIRWQDFLTQQDRQKLWPHITVQNKVAVQKAQELLNKLKDTFTPMLVPATGLQLWEYLNGPWKLVEDFPFLHVKPSPV